MGKRRKLLSATAGEKVFDVFVYATLGLCFLLWFFPLIYVLLASFTPYKDVVKGSLLIIPSSFTLTGYEYIFNSTNIFKSFGNTLFITVVGTSLSMTVTILLAFPLSRKDLPGRSVLLKLLVFTMYFSGGLIPTYMVVRNLKLVNTIWAMIIPGATGDAEAEEYVPTITVQMSAIVFACIPIICVYPFLQKYFTKGVMLGAIKG